MIFDKKKSNEIAQRLLGMTFELGGRGPNKIDCYGILCLFYAEFGIEMPDFTKLDDWEADGHNSSFYLDQYTSLARKLSEDESPERGDFILFKNIEGSPNHAGVYLGDNRFIHSYQKVGVKIDSLTQRPWKEKVSGYFRIRNQND